MYDQFHHGVLRKEYAVLILESVGARRHSHCVHRVLPPVLHVGNVTYYYYTIDAIVQCLKPLRADGPGETCTHLHTRDSGVSYYMNDKTFFSIVTPLQAKRPG